MDNTLVNNLACKAQIFQQHFFPEAPLPVQPIQDVTVGPEVALVASLVQRVAGGDAPEEEES